VSTSCSSLALSSATNGDWFLLLVSVRRPHTSNTANVNGKRKLRHKTTALNLDKMSTRLQVVPAEYSQTPPTATYFHFRLPRGDPTRRTRPMSVGKIRGVINYKLHELTKSCQHTPTLFRPSTLKRHQRRLIPTSGFCEATTHVDHGQCQWEKEATNFDNISTCLQVVPA